MRADEAQQLEFESRQQMEGLVIFTAQLYKGAINKPPSWFPPDWQDILSADPEYQEWLNRQENQEIKMPIIAKATSGKLDFKLLPQGTHLAVCDRIVNLGIQKTEWSGQVKFQPKVYIRFQVPLERIEIQGEEKPMVVGSTYTLSLSEKSNLHKHLQGWRGKSFTKKELESFDILNVLGKPCQISISHNDTGERTYANIDAIMALPKGVDAPEVEGDTLVFESPDATPDALELLPEWQREKILAGFSQEEEAEEETEEEASDFSDEIPF